MRPVSKGNVGGDGEGGYRTLLTSLPLFDCGCGLPSVSGSQTWSLALGDYKYGSGLSSLFREYNFYL